MEMEMIDMQMQLRSMEQKLENLMGTVDGLADAVVARVVRALDATERAPLVLTRRQLQAAVRAAMDGDSAGNSDDSGNRKRPEEEEVGVGGEEGEEVVKVVTPPATVKHKPTKSAETTVSQRVELDFPSDSLSLSMLDEAIGLEAQVVPFTPVLFPKKPQKPKQPTKQPQFPPTAVVRRPVAVAPPPQPSAPTAVVRPPTKPAPTRPSVVTPPPPPSQQRPPRPLSAPVQAAPTVSGRLYLWGNAWHNLPEDYEFPKISVELMWRQWCCGDTECGYLPLREIQASDVASSNNRKRLSDLKYIMKFIEQRLQERDVWKESPSATEADQMLNAVRGELFPDSTTKSGMKRDAEGLKWHSAVTLLRSAHKKARTE